MDLPISDKMSKTKMEDKVCKYNNTGYCKFEKGCKFLHPTEVCEGGCETKKCKKRHPRMCRYQIDCKRKETCAYKHVTNSPEVVVRDEMDALRSIVKNLQDENKKNKAEIVKLKNDLVKVEEKMVKKLASSKPEKEEILATNKEKKTVGDSRIKQSEKGESNKKDYSRCPDATEVIKGENKRCPRCGEIFNKQTEMIAHVKEQHVNFANSVLHMAESKAWEKKPKTEEEQREFDYFKALAVKLKTADVC